MSTNNALSREPLPKSRPSKDQVRRAFLERMRASRERSYDMLRRRMRATAA